MTTAPDNEDLHDLINRLTPEQAQEFRLHALSLLERENREAVPQRRSTPRESSIVGLIHAEPDLAERAKDILRGVVHDRSVR